MESLVITIHIIACVTLVLLVLLQSRKKDMEVIFGGGSSYPEALIDTAATQLEFSACFPPPDAR